MCKLKELKAYSSELCRTMDECTWFQLRIDYCPKNNVIGWMAFDVCWRLSFDKRITKSNGERRRIEIDTICESSSDCSTKDISIL